MSLFKNTAVLLCACALVFAAACDRNGPDEEPTTTTTMTDEEPSTTTSVDGDDTTTTVPDVPDQDEGILIKGVFQPETSSTAARNSAFALQVDRAGAQVRAYELDENGDPIEEIPF